MTAVCDPVRNELFSISGNLDFFKALIMISSIGMLSSVLQKLSILKLKENAEIDNFVVVMNILLVFIGMINFVKLNGFTPQNNVLSEACGPILGLEQGDADKLDRVFGLVNEYGQLYSF